MDPERFDRLIRSLSRPASRRQALGILASGFGIFAGAGAIEAKGKRSRGDRRHHPKKRGNSACAHFCAEVFGDDTPKAGACTRDGAHRRGLCYQCGPNAKGTKLTLCGQQCVRLGTDDNCRDCGDACPAGRHCVDGRCQATGDCQSCGADQVCCNDQCVTGTCCADGDCGTHAHCARHACACDQGFHACAGTCVSDQDVATCGTSCQPCPSSICSPATCDGRQCGRAPIAGCCAHDGECDDGNPCSTDTCDPTTRTCAHTNAPSSTTCDGGSCCGGACCQPPANASPTCAGGTCGFACDAGFHRCGDRCVSDDDVAHCGASCTACPTDPHGTATCVGGTCGIACDSGFHACNGQCVNNSNVATCGARCAPCPSGSHATATCDGATCGLQCDAGWANCDADPSTGCETQLGTTTDCAGCGDACPAGFQCFNGTCSLACGYDCANFNHCSGHGVCTPDCTCLCDPPWTGISCSDLPVKTCPDYVTCGECMNHRIDGCVWCAVTGDGTPGDVCTAVDNCVTEILDCPA
ncbi:MAG: hypothetical protein IT336_07075 [Thermomicrobiales bacterium]|nr:hypothetical protein [Thermomicrobiales bacterium]